MPAPDIPEAVVVSVSKIEVPKAIHNNRQNYKTTAGC